MKIFSNTIKLIPSSVDGWFHIDFIFDNEND